MTRASGNAEETRIAQEILSVLPNGSVARVCSDDRESIRFTVESGELKLRAVVLNRESLRRLEADPARAVKIEYLQRDLARSAKRRVEFRYPRVTRVGRNVTRISRLRVANLAAAAIGC